ncbi:MAG: antirestriction protein, partial [Bacteroides sp.]|nr:antirestriction protein [Bacteroides sp.]
MAEATKKGTFYSGNVQTVLNGILDQFESGDIPNTVSVAMFPTVDSPSENWSLLNRIAMITARTCDARTFKQWQKVERKVSKGSKAIHILAPIVKGYKTEDENGEEEKRQYISGFKALPVFRYEDTEGEPLIEAQVEQSLPLLSRAQEWGITVTNAPGNEFYLGYYQQDREVIALATPSESVFFHELAHAAHKKVLTELTPGQDPLQEIVAELSAAALCRMVGKNPEDTTGNSYQYIKRYAEELEMSPYRACMKVLAQTQKVLSLILDGDTDSHEAEIVATAA